MEGISSAFSIEFDTCKVRKLLAWGERPLTSRDNRGGHTVSMEIEK